jgi:hypothetical protein
LHKGGFGSKYRKIKRVANYLKRNAGLQRKMGTGNILEEHA